MYIVQLTVYSVHCSVFSVPIHAGGYCTGDNYRDERPIDVFVLNTATYRWSEVAKPVRGQEEEDCREKECKEKEKCQEKG